MRNSQNPDKILHIITVAFSISYFFGRQFSYLITKSGNEYHLGCSPSDNFFELATDLNYIPFSIPITREITPVKDILVIIAIYKYIRKNKITKVVGHTPKGGMLAMIASFLANVPNRIYFRHGLIYETSFGPKRFLLKNIEKVSGMLATDVVCVSKSIQKISERDKLNSAKKNIVLGLGTCNGVDTEEKYNPTSYDISDIKTLAEKLGISEGDFVVGFVGRLVKDKGVNELISAWDILKERFENIKLLLVGPLESRDPISKYAEERVLNDPSVIFTDFVLDASAYYSLMDIFVLPSYREGFPTVVLEASSMKIPVLVTRATGCEEAISEGVTGLFINHDPEDIASKIQFYLCNPNVARKHGENGRKFVCENFDQKKIWDLLNNDLEI